MERYYFSARCQLAVVAGGVGRRRYLEKDKGAAQEECQSLCALLDEHAGTEAADSAKAELVGTA